MYLKLSPSKPDLPWTKGDFGLSDVMSSYWTNFVKTAQIFGQVDNADVARPEAGINARFFQPGLQRIVKLGIRDRLALRRLILHHPRIGVNCLCLETRL